MSDSYQDYDYSEESSEFDDSEDSQHSVSNDEFSIYVQSLNDEQFFDRFRMSKQTFEYVFSMLDLPDKTRGQMIDPRLDLLIFLRYLATGSFMSVAGDLTTRVRSINQPT